MLSHTPDTARKTASQTFHKHLPEFWWLLLRTDATPLPRDSCASQFSELRLDHATADFIAYPLVASRMQFKVLDVTKVLVAT